MSGLVKYSIIVVIIIMGILLLSGWTRKPSSGLSPTQLQRLCKGIEQAKYLKTAATRDKHVVLALIHITAALTKLKTYRAMLPDADLQQCGENIANRIRQFEQYQARVLAELKTQAPAVALPASVNVSLDKYV